MAKTYRRRGLEKRLAKLGFELWAIKDKAGFAIRPEGTRVQLWAYNLDYVERITDWLEEKQGLRGFPEPPGEDLDVESRNSGFLRAIVQDSIKALETAGEIDELILLLGWLKQTIKGLDPDYDVTQDPT